MTWLPVPVLFASDMMRLRPWSRYLWDRIESELGNGGSQHVSSGRDLSISGSTFRYLGPTTSSFGSSPVPGEISLAPEQRGGYDFVPNVIWP